MIDIPKLMDIATKEVQSISESKTIQDAVNIMYTSNHRDVIILSDKKHSFGILKANDLVKLRLDGVDFKTPLQDIKYDSVSSVDCSMPIAEALSEVSASCNCICLVDDKNRLCGYVSYYDIISSVDPKMMLEKRTLSDILISSYVKEALSTTSTQEVISMMDSSIYDSVIIFDKNQKGVGIVTTKDIVKFFGENSDISIPISHYMSKPLHTVKHTTTISQALEFIQDKHFKRLIVEDYDGNIVGQITQEELIARVYAKWADFMRNEKSQLTQVNTILQQRASHYERAASFDRLTDLPNRTKFEESVKEEISRVERYGSDGFCVVLFDVDNFKSINDTYGHLQGDIILQGIAQVVKNAIRTTDVVCRWGGEEFMVCMPVTSVVQGEKAANKIRQAIADLVFEQVGQVTCSFGVTQFEKSDTLQSLISKADKAMYHAKNTGKNKVEVFR